ncbi:MAG: hypothetical protein AAFP09_11010 [Cyanobacteria bacterium J06607_10]
MSALFEAGGRVVVEAEGQGLEEEKKKKKDRLSDQQKKGVQGRAIAFKESGGDRSQEGQ